MPENIKNFVFRNHRRIADIGTKDWDRCAGDRNPFVSYGFLSALEESGSVRAETGWLPHHLSFSNLEGNIDAVVPMYLKSHSYGEYVFDHDWAEAFERAGGTYYPKLQVCVPFSPVPGPRLLRQAKSTVSLQDIGSALKEIMEASGMSSVHMTFCAKEEYEQMAEQHWLQRMGVQFHWHNNNYKNFDDFLNALTSSHRKSIKRERREAQASGLTFETLRGDDIKAVHWDAFYQFYQNTIDRKWGSAYLTRDFFDLLSQKLGNKIILMMAFHEGTPVAGALNLLGDKTLYGRNWGCGGQWPFLHFELCYYRALDFAIGNGLTSVEAGAQGEHKVQRGYLPQLTYSTHLIAHQGLSQAVDHFLGEERKAIEEKIAILGEYSPFKKMA